MIKIFFKEIGSHDFIPIKNRKNHPYQKDRFFEGYTENKLNCAAHILTPAFVCKKCDTTLVFNLKPKIMSYSVMLLTTRFNKDIEKEKLLNCNEYTMHQALS